MDVDLSTQQKRDEHKRHLERVHRDAEVEFKVRNTLYLEAQNEWHKKFQESDIKIKEAERKLKVFEESLENHRALATLPEDKITKRRDELKKAVEDAKAAKAKQYAEGEVALKSYLDSTDKANIPLKEAKKALDEYLEIYDLMKEPEKAPEEKKE